MYIYNVRGVFYCPTTSSAAGWVSGGVGTASASGVGIVASDTLITGEVASGDVGSGDVGTGVVLPDARRADGLEVVIGARSGALFGVAALVGDSGSWGLLCPSLSDKPDVTASLVLLLCPRRERRRKSQLIRLPSLVVAALPSLSSPSFTLDLRRSPHDLDGLSLSCLDALDLLR